MKRVILSAFMCVLALASVCAAQTAQRAMSVDDLLRVRRVADPQLSPDGKWIAYSVAVPDVGANRSRTQVYLISIAGGEARALTSGEASASGARWSPDGRRIAFVSGGQLWTMDAQGGERKQVTSISTGAGDPIWSPDGKWLAFVSDIYPDCADDECNKRRDSEAEANKVKARTIDRLLYRHWTAWKEGKRTHVFVVSSDGGAARDVTPGDYDAPPFSLGGPTDYAFSPDSKELAFARNTEKVEATSTNSDIFIVPVAGGEAQLLTGTNKGADQSPLYSPDGRYLAYRSQQTAGFESDRWRLMLYDRQTRSTRELSPQFDAYVETFTFSPDSKYIYFASEERGREPVFVASTAGGTPARLIAGFNDDVHLTPDGKTLIFTRSSAIRPTEIYRATLEDPLRVASDGNAITKLTHENDDYMAQFDLNGAEELTWTGGGGTRVSGWLVKPVGFQEGKKYPLLVLIHGGPQGAWNDSWGYRWNPQIFAGQGYMVFLPNPRGSTGYGQQFTNEISGDWGGKVFDDIKNGVAYVIEQGSVDKERIGAAGGSYGGYMVNWIEGHNDDARFRFKALVSHAGVYNLTSMYGVTEELWFPEWEFKGTPWDNPELYARWSPNMFVKNFKTPLLVVHGEIDYRVPFDQGLQLFTALQKMNVESKLLEFPDEGHWVLKPQNSALWYKTVTAWFDKHLK
jgi:dipeptidyl aminopeptidase/acylaminoacyl peptidase